jgi:hypothetical protein
MPNLDVELASQPAYPARGFALVASKIASDSDKTTTIYRRFDELSARNLLFYQAELAELEGQQRDYDEVDRNAKDQASIQSQPTDIRQIAKRHQKSLFCPLCSEISQRLQEVYLSNVRCLY